MRKLMLRLRRIKVGFILGFILLVAACASPQPAPSTSILATQAPSPVSTPSVLRYATPRQGLGGITGRLVAGSVNGPGYMGGDLYLGRLIPGSDPKAPPAVAFSNDSDPKADIYNTDGTFAFTNVQPGNYALVMWNPALDFVIEYPKGTLLEVTVTQNKVTDLGTIVIP